MRTIPSSPSPFLRSVAMAALVAGLGLGTPHLVGAQTTNYDNTYGSGSYGGDFEYSATLTPTPSPGSSVSPTASQDGNLPLSWAGVRWMAIFGLFASSAGLGLYGLNRRRRAAGVPK